MSFGYDYIHQCALVSRRRLYYLYSYSVRLRRCSSFSDGQCESLYRAGEQRIQAFTLFYIPISPIREPIGHDGGIMKQNKNEELQSRREFFKRAAKGALPILGAIALANMPVIANAGESAMGCKYGCSTGCYTACQGSCKSSCSGSCKNGCDGCKYTCSGSCKNSCSGTCKHSSSR